MPRLVELNDRFGKMGVRFVSIDSGTRSAAADAFLAENHVKHTVLNDSEDKVMKAYRIVAIPVTVMIDQDGRVIFRHVGYSDDMLPRIQRELETLIAWRDAAKSAA